MIERYEIRDMETHKIKEKFKWLGSSQNYLSSMLFGVGNYYEIYDTKTKTIMPRSIRGKDNKFFKKNEK